MSLCTFRSTCRCPGLRQPEDNTGIMQSDDAVDDEATCVICMEALDNPASIVKLGCEHTFHGQCLVQHLLRDKRCPVCRFDEHAVDEDSDSFSEDEPREPYVSFKDAMKAARLASRTDKATKASLATISKWHKATKEAKAKMVDAWNKIAPHEQVMQDKIEAYERKAQADFELKFAKKLAEHTGYEKELQKARTNYRNARTRVAKKHGFRNWRFSRRRRVRDGF